MKKAEIKIGQKVRWKVDEECPYRCPTCGRDGHELTHALTTFGMVLLVGGYPTTECFGKQGEKHERTSFNNFGHKAFVAFPLDFDRDPGDGKEAIGAWFRPDELEVIE